MLTRALLVCGILAAPLFILTDLVAAFWLYPGFDITAQQVSELSAIGAPSRDFWMLMSYPYFALNAAFAVGVWRAGTSPSLRLTAILLMLFAVNSLLWGFVAPMHMRGETFNATDTMHLLFAVAVRRLGRRSHRGDPLLGRHRPGARLPPLLGHRAGIDHGGRRPRKHQHRSHRRQPADAVDGPPRTDQCLRPADLDGSPCHQPSALNRPALAAKVLGRVEIGERPFGRHHPLGDLQQVPRALVTLYPQQLG